MRLIKPAPHDAGILKMVVLRHYGAYLPGRRHRRLHCGRFPRPVLRHRFCWRRLWPSLTMRDELGIAGRTRPWRHTIRQAASPMRPMIGDKAATACEIKPKPEHERRFNEPRMRHIRCRISCLTQVSLPPHLRMDSIRGETMVSASHMRRELRTIAAHRGQRVEPNAVGVAARYDAKAVMLDLGPRLAEIWFAHVLPESV